MSYEKVRSTLYLHFQQLIYSLISFKSCRTRAGVHTMQWSQSTKVEKMRAALGDNFSPVSWLKRSHRHTTTLPFSQEMNCRTPKIVGSAPLRLKGTCPGEYYNIILLKNLFEYTLQFHSMTEQERFCNQYLMV